MNEQTKKATKRTRRWLKVSLRTFLLAITVLCVWLGFIVSLANKQKQAVEWVREHGGTVYYDFEWNDEELFVDNAEPPGPSWLRDRIGIDYLTNVVYVELLSQEINDLLPLADIKSIQWLDLKNTQVSVLSPLAGMSDMQWLDLKNTRVSNLSPLAGMKELQGIYLENTQVSDLSPLVEMKQLRIYLDLVNKAKIPPELKSQVVKQPG